MTLIRCTLNFDINTSLLPISNNKVKVKVSVIFVLG